MPSALSPKDWEGMVSNAGFKVEQVASVYPKEFLIDIWNVGIRSIAHLIIQMADEISATRRLEIKSEWVDIACELIMPLVMLPNTCPLDRSPYILLVARK